MVKLVLSNGSTVTTPRLPEGTLGATVRAYELANNVKVKVANYSPPKVKK